MKIDEVSRITFPIVAPRTSRRLRDEKNREFESLKRNRAKNTPSFLEILESIQNKKQ